MGRLWILLMLVGSATLAWANAVPGPAREWAPKRSGDVPLPPDKETPAPTSPWPTAALGLGLTAALAGGGLLVAVRRRRAG